PTKPRSLSPQQSADVVAYLLSMNKIPAGEAELTARARQGSGGGGNAPPPEPQKIEGKPIDTRPTEKSDNKPWFPQQTRAPYHRTAPFKTTTIVDGLPSPWAV